MLAAAARQAASLAPGPSPAASPTAAPGSAPGAVPPPAPLLPAAPGTPSPAPLGHPSAGLAPPPGAGQESAITQLSALRQALRSARPELTLRHSEFGAVALRIAAAIPDGWRAVLASHDPAFVPAVQAALAERAASAGAAAAASADPASSGGDAPRYGSSPGSGQGGSQPYSGQSQGREGHPGRARAASTATLIAARAEGTGAPDAQAGGGIFA
jgi:hypothetical protein